MERINKLRQKFNFWVGGEQTWPKIDYLTLQTEDKQLNLSALNYSTERINKLWLVCFILTLVKLATQLWLYFSDRQDSNIPKFQAVILTYTAVIFIVCLLM